MTSSCLCLPSLLWDLCTLFSLCLKFHHIFTGIFVLWNLCALFSLCLKFYHIFALLKYYYSLKSNSIFTFSILLCNLLSYCGILESCLNYLTLCVLTFKIEIVIPMLIK